MAQTITIKRGLKADLPVLEPLEIGYCTDTREVFIGSSAGNIPVVEALTGAFMVGLINAGADKINDANLSANVADAINKKHSHSNLAVLNAIEEAFTTVLKNKLDGIASGATKVEGSTTNGNVKIDNTETNVYTLEAHKHVKADITDFPTSMPANGGNADTVGGKNPSDFAPSGYGLGTYQNISNNDLNIIISTGLYSGNGMINAPNNSNNGWSVIVLGGSSGYCRQIAISANEDKTIYVRNEIAGTWNGWTQIANISDIPTTLPANGGTSSFLGNAVNIDDYDTLNPTLIAQGNITPIKAPSTANSPWPHTSAGFLIQSNDVDSFHMLIFMSGGDGWAYRSYYQGAWSNWKIWSTFDGNYNNLSNRPSIPTKTSQITNDGDGTSTFVTANQLGNAGYGDMLKSVYDTDNDGVVDKAETLPGLGKKSADDLPSTWPIGIYWSDIYNNGFPCSYGNCLSIKSGVRSITQLCLEWKGADATIGSMWIRNKRDTGADEFSPWREFSFDGHTHIISNIMGLQSALDAKAPIASPTFTGTPKSVTPATADNSTNIATTAFVKAQGYITAAGSGAKIAVSSTAPSSPQPGDFWYKV